MTQATETDQRCLRCERALVRPLPDQLFCSGECRRDYHRALGKAVEARLNSVSPRSDKSVTLVIRLSGEAAKRARTWSPGERVVIHEHESKA